MFGLLCCLLKVLVAGESFKRIIFILLRDFKVWPITVCLVGLTAMSYTNIEYYLTILS